MNVKFRCNGKQMAGEVVKKNNLTVWVRVQFTKTVMERVGEKMKKVKKPYEKVIKRHKEKHAVVFIGA